MYVHTLNPSLFSWGIIDIRYYSLAYIIGALLIYFFYLYLIRKKRISLSEQQLDILTVYLFIGAVVCGRVGYFLLYRPDVFFTNPILILEVWKGGMSFHGGLLGSALMLWLFSKRYKVRLLEVSDALIVPMTVTLALGRLANFINGELVGTPTDVAWCVIFPAVDELCRHPSQLYQSAKNIVLLVITGILYWYTLRKKLPIGVTSYGFLLGYGVLRFVITFLRDDPERVWLFSLGQVYCLIMIVVGAVGLWYVLQHSKQSRVSTVKKR
ncbi:MAG: prolipoprotein diacylglyceryl transferase [Candidatus Woesearchaeota archaeon]